MKKLYAVVFLLVATTLVGCGTQNLEVNEAELTGENLEMTSENIEMTGDEVLLEVTEEDMKDFDSTEVTKVAGSDEVDTNSWIVAEVKAILDDRDPSTVDEVKLTEEDIDDMDKIIQMVQNLAN